MKARYYQVGELLYPSVTTVLAILRKPGLERWRGRLGNEEADRISEEAKHYGSGLHDAWHRLLVGGEMNEKFAAPLRALQVWFQSRGAEVILTEHLVISHKHKYAGRVDVVVRLPSGLYVLDIKTTDYVAPEYPLQLAAYQQALREDGFDVRGGYLLCIPRMFNRISEHFFEGSIELPVFLHLRRIFDYFAPLMFTEAEVVGTDADEN